MKNGLLRRRIFVYVKNRGNLALLKVLLLCVLLSVAALAVNARLRPLIRAMGIANAKYRVTEAINNAIIEEIAANREAYADIVVFERGTEGQIAALRTDVVKMNLMKAEILKRILASIRAISPAEIGVPLGSLSGSDLFYGAGPRIPVRLIPAETASADFISAFESVGINQTRHRILIEVEAEIGVLLPGGKAPAEIKTQVVVAETVLLGNVPESYAYIDISGGSG